MGNKVHELGLLLDEEVEMLMQEADCKSVSGESKRCSSRCGCRSRRSSRSCGIKVTGSKDMQEVCTWKIEMN